MMPFASISTHENHPTRCRFNDKWLHKRDKATKNAVAEPLNGRVFPTAEVNPIVRVHFGFATLDGIEKEYRGYGIPVVVPSVLAAGRREVDVQACCLV